MLVNLDRGFQNVWDDTFLVKLGLVREALAGQVTRSSRKLACYAEFLLDINLKILLRKTGVRLNLKIELVYLNIDPCHHSIHKRKVNLWGKDV
jgi:hypothetical protein